MKQLIATFLLSFALITLMAQESSKPSFYDFTVKTIDGKDYSFENLRGKKVLIVNTASKCGFTPQYEALESLYADFGGEKFEIIGFPANNFMNQEPGTNDDIKSFCTEKYGVTFPMMSKISVKGKDMDPLYKWLTSKDLNGIIDSEVKWNFQKYLIDESGRIVRVVPSKESPLSDEIVSWLKK